MFAVIGGIISVVVLKFLESEGEATEIRDEDELNEAKKQPQEHDERLCWEGECGFWQISFQRFVFFLTAKERRH